MSDHEAEEPPTQDGLRQKWEDHKACLRQLAAMGKSDDDPTVIAERVQAQAAKAAYDAARPSCPSSRRLQFAEQALERAQRAQEKAQEHHDQVVAAYEAELAEARQRLADAAANTAMRQENLDERRREIGASAPVEEEVDEAEEGRAALNDVVKGLDDKVGPQLAALRDKVGVDTDLGRGLCGVIDQLDCMYNAARAAATAAAEREDRRRANRVDVEMDDALFGPPPADDGPVPALSPTPAASAPPAVQPCAPPADDAMDMDTRASRRVGDPVEEGSPAKKRNAILDAGELRKRAEEANVSLESVDLAQLSQERLQCFAEEHGLIVAW